MLPVHDIWAVPYPVFILEENSLCFSFLSLIYLLRRVKNKEEPCYWHLWQVLQGDMAGSVLLLYPHPLIPSSSQYNWNSSICWPAGNPTSSFLVVFFKQHFSSCQLLSLLFYSHCNSALIEWNPKFSSLIQKCLALLRYRIGWQTHK